MPTATKMRIINVAGSGTVAFAPATEPLPPAKFSPAQMLVPPFGGLLSGSRYLNQSLMSS
jgi:hypothetical protein